MYRDISGCQSADVRYAGKESESSIYLDWGELGNYGTDSEIEQYLGNREGTCDLDGCKTARVLRTLKFWPMAIFCDKRKGVLLENKMRKH